MPTEDSPKDACPKCGAILKWTVMPMCWGENAHPWHSSVQADSSVAAQVNDDYEIWEERSRLINPSCGCDKRGNRLFRCSYHEGARDGWAAHEELRKK